MRKLFTVVNVSFQIAYPFPVPFPRAIGIPIKHLHTRSTRWHPLEHRRHQDYGGCGSAHCWRRSVLPRFTSQLTCLIQCLGWHGLVMAKTYLEVNPSVKLVILESAESIGGVWSKRRLYPGLKSNNLLGTYEYSDFPMDQETFGVKPGEPIPGHVLHHYLQRYAEKFDVYRRISFNSRVESVERNDGKGWVVNSSKVGDTTIGIMRTILAKKLVISTGLTSEPFVPAFVGSDSFDAPIFHAKYLLNNIEATSKNSSNIIILGGSKSAFDAAYEYASKGTTVDWIIRETGHGPVWMAPPYVTPLKKRLEKLVGVRFLTWFSPCIWGDSDGFGGVRKLLHNTSIGRWIVDAFWYILGNDVMTANGYDKHPETVKLKPWTPAFWIASSLSILNYPTDFFQLVRDGTIRVHVADITHLSPKTVHLSSGESIHGDALVCSTGWKHRPSIKFYPEGIDEQLGLPRSFDGPEDVLVGKTDNEILHRFPRLLAQPIINEKYKPLKGDDSAKALNRPFRLYRFMVPPAYINDRSIGFSGMMMSIHTSSCAQAQALWLTAYLSGRLLRDRKPSKEGQSTRPEDFDNQEVQWETVLQSQFGKWRYPAGYGEKFPDFVFDAIPYIDMLLKDLGLKWLRKKSRWSEWFDPYGPEDYRGLVDEWRIEVRFSL